MFLSCVLRLNGFHGFKEKDLGDSLRAESPYSADVLQGAPGGQGRPLLSRLRALAREEGSFVCVVLA